MSNPECKQVKTQPPAAKCLQSKCSSHSVQMLCTCVSGAWQDRFIAPALQRACNLYPEYAVWSEWIPYTKSDFQARPGQFMVWHWELCWNVASWNECCFEVDSEPETQGERRGSRQGAPMWADKKWLTQTRMIELHTSNPLNRAVAL